jgi:hypothetical protein
MIIECEFTNATNFVRERVVFLTGMKIMIDSEHRLFGVSWDGSKDQPTASLTKLHKAMHDSEFRIHLDREGFLVTMARCLGARWTVWYISIDWRPEERIYSKICVLQRAFRRRFMLRRLCIDRVFSKTAAACEMLKGRLHDDVLCMIVAYCMHIPLQNPPYSPLSWIKRESDGQIFA